MTKEETKETCGCRQADKKPKIPLGKQPPNHCDKLGPQGRGAHLS